MRGVYCDGTRAWLRSDLPEPVPSDQEVCLKVRAVGVCDTDLQLAQGYMGFRGILGHEFVGETSDGRRVTSEINFECGRCHVCRFGPARHCPHRTVLGILNHDGAMAERVCVPKRYLREVPDTIDDQSAVFIEPLAAAFRIPEQVELNSRINIAVLGDGKLGLLCAWVARLKGACVHLIGKHPEKLALAGDGIETHLLQSSTRQERECDVVVDCTGSPTGFTTALRFLRPNGVLVLKTTVAGDAPLNLAPIVIDEIRVIGSRCGPFPTAIDALATRQIDVRPLIESVYTLDQADDALRAAAVKGARKILMTVA